MYLQEDLMVDPHVGIPTRRAGRILTIHVWVCRTWTRYAKTRNPQPLAALTASVRTLPH